MKDGITYKVRKGGSVTVEPKKEKPEPKKEVKKDAN